MRSAGGGKGAGGEPSLAGSHHATRAIDCAEYHLLDHCPFCPLLPLPFLAAVLDSRYATLAYDLPAVSIVTLNYRLVCPTRTEDAADPQDEDAVDARSQVSREMRLAVGPAPDTGVARLDLVEASE